MPTTDIPNPPTKVIEQNPNGSFPYNGPVPSSALIIQVASAADTIVGWGIDPRTRDAQLRAFWPTEYLFSGALFTVVSRYVAFEWSLKGPPRTVGIAQDVLNSVQFGKGWEALVTPVLIDMFTQDNGAFMEVVRTDDDPRAPVVSLNHLDAHRCIRTGRVNAPVHYIDLNGRTHELKWYNVIELTEMPSPIEEARGMQYCALTRALRAAQILRDICVVRQEKASGRFTRQVHLVGGVQTRVIEDAMTQKQFEADVQGLTRYIQSTIVAALDPTARVTKETIDLASIPDDYDEEKAQRSYMMALAMVFGIDFQDLSPLPGGGLGSGSQSKVLNMKSRGKGPRLFMNKLARLFNFHGLLPPTVTFEFGRHDAADQMEQVELRRTRALEREIRVRSGEITTEVARQLAVDDGDLDERYLIMMREENATNEVIATPTEPLLNDASGVKPGMPGPKEPPQSAQPGFGGAVPRPANSNDKRPQSPATNQGRTPGGTRGN